jgi:hypothetical protein
MFGYVLSRFLVELISKIDEILSFDKDQIRILGTYLLMFVKF